MNRLQKLFSLTSWSLWLLRDLVAVFLYATCFLSVVCSSVNTFTYSSKIERKAMIRNRYNYPTPPIRDIKEKETQTLNNWTLMETSLAESQTDIYFPTMWSNGYPKPKNVSDTNIQRRTITKINHDRRTALERSVKSISLGGRGRGVRGRA